MLKYFYLSMSYIQKKKKVRPNKVRHSTKTLSSYSDKPIHQVVKIMTHYRTT